MKNKEKFKEEIMELACDHHRIAVDEITGKVVHCNSIKCEKCRFNSVNCTAQLREWAEAEYKEPLSAEAIYDKFYEFCHSHSNQTCNDCKYSHISYATKCAMKFVFDNYEVKEKEEVPDNEQE